MSQMADNIQEMYLAFEERRERDQSRQRLIKERSFLCQLDFTEAQLRAYDNRIQGIAQRLQLINERKRMKQ